MSLGKFIILHKRRTVYFGQIQIFEIAYCNRYRSKERVFDLILRHKHDICLFFRKHGSPDNLFTINQSSDKIRWANFLLWCLIFYMFFFSNWVSYLPQKKKCKNRAKTFGTSYFVTALAFPEKLPLISDLNIENVCQTSIWSKKKTIFSQLS